MSVLSSFLLVYGVILLIGLGLGLVSYIFQSIGLYKMAKTLNLNNPWMAWVPFLSTYTLGKIGSKYVKNDGKPSAKFGGWLLGIEIAMFVVLIAMGISLIGMIPNIITMAEADLAAPSTELFINFASVLGTYLLLFAFAIAFSVIYYIALWRLFAIFDNSTATVFLIVSILFGVATPFLIFAVRNNRPTVTYAERMGFVPQAESVTPIQPVLEETTVSENPNE